MKRFLKSITPNFLIKIVRRMYGTKPLRTYHCNVCDRTDFFEGWYRPYQIDSKCPNCGSIERTRFMYEILSKNIINELDPTKTKILHFAPEPIIENYLRRTFASYTSADLFAEADIIVNIEDIKLPEESYDIVIASHVLEHVDDRLAVNQIEKILKSAGKFVCMVPMVQGWDETYEDLKVIDPSEREIHFGQSDHLRMYGRDFVSRVETQNLKLRSLYTADGVNSARYKWDRGDKLYVFEKSSKAL